MFAKTNRYMPKITGKYVSSSKERVMQTVLKPRSYIIIQQDRHNHFMRGESEHLRIIIDDYISKMPEEKQKKLIDEYYYRVNKSKQNKQP